VTTDRPSHITGNPGAKWTLCGIRIKDKEALPYTGARYVEMHIERRGAVFCADCLKERAASAAAPRQLDLEDG
jgi:hypothetical protein